jgi:chromate transporter
MADLARLFLKMSVLAFGGPVAHIAMGQNEIVEKRAWLSRADYLDMVAATNLIPGPNSTEMMIHVGYVKQGVKGAVLAGVCFILPAALITLVITMAYVAGGQLPQVGALLWGVQPVILAIIAVAGWRLVPTALKDRVLWAVAVVSFALLVFTDAPEVLVMVGGGLFYALIRAARVAGTAMLSALPVLVPGGGLAALLQTGAAAVAAPAVVPSLAELFFYFLRIGAVLFGSGYVLVAYIQQDLVQTFGWLSARQLLDAVAIGQFTPGPVLTTATAVGYITLSAESTAAGMAGALVATLGVFLPSFVLVILTAPLLLKMKRSTFLRRFLDGANAAVLAAMAAAVLALAGEAVRPLSPLTLPVGGISLVAVGLFAFAFFAQVRLKWNATWLVLIGAAFGLGAGVLGAGL